MMLSTDNCLGILKIPLLGEIKPWLASFDVTLLLQMGFQNASSSPSFVFATELSAFKARDLRSGRVCSNSINDSGWGGISQDIIILEYWELERSPSVIRDYVPASYHIWSHKSVEPHRTLLTCPDTPGLLFLMVVDHYWSKDSSLVIVTCCDMGISVRSVHPGHSQPVVVLRFWLSSIGFAHSIHGPWNKPHHCQFHLDLIWTP